jgi:uncharacterized protein (DUF433 family)
MPKTNTIAEQNAVEVPLYTYLDVARYLRLPLWASFAMPGHPRFHPEEMLHFLPHPSLFFKRFPDDEEFLFPEDRSQRISFRALANLFVYSFIFRIPRKQDGHREDNRHLFESVWETVHRALRDPKPFAELDVDYLLSHVRSDVIRSADLSPEYLRKLINLHIERIEIKDEMPVRLYPFSRDPSPDVPRFVLIDPEIRFGRPTVKGAPTDVLIERWRAGDSPQDLADDYGLTTEEVEEALRYESAPCPLSFPFPFFGW